MRTITVDEDMSDAPVIVIPDERVEVVEWHIAPDDEKRWAVWEDCRLQWLRQLERRSGKPNTRRAYERDFVQFFLAFQLENLMPWQVSRLHALHWVDALVQRGYSRSTINRKVACMSSFYHYASNDYTLNTGNGERGLWEYANPFGAKSLHFKVSPYGNAVWPTTDEVGAILDQIDTATLTGLRNFALLFGIFGTTRRVSEWIGLQWGDLHETSDGWWFHYCYKGESEKSRRQKIPTDVWNVVKKYLVESGRWGTLKANDYVFISHSDAATNLKHVDDYHREAQSISASYVNALLKRYGIPAGVEESRLHAHALRHAGAHFRLEHGAELPKLQEILGHKSIATTQIYIQNALATPEDKLGDQFIGAVLPKQLRFNV
jgi:integrase/recombinase XerC